MIIGYHPLPPRVLTQKASLAKIRPEPVYRYIPSVGTSMDVREGMVSEQTTPEPLPMDTMLDRLWAEEGLPEHVLTLMKVLYLAFDSLNACAAAHRWTKTQLIDAVETARRAGAIRIVYNQRAETFQLKLTSDRRTEAGDR